MKCEVIDVINFVKHYFLVRAMAHRGMINIIPANNVLLPQDCLTENWTLVQMIGEFSDTRDV